MKKISVLKIITLLIVLITSILVFKFNKTLRVPSIFDGNFYNTIDIPTATKPYHLKEANIALPDLSLWCDSINYHKYLYTDIFLQNSHTTSFLVLRNDSLIFKRYLNGVKEGDNTQIFSSTKVFITASLGIAIEQGLIKSINEPVSYFFPNKNPMFDSLTLYDLCQMKSGINYDEYGNLYQTLKFYYLQNVTQAINNAKFKYRPGEKFVYKSIDTQILGECIRKSTPNKKYVDFFYDNIWNKIGAQDSAYFAVDSKINKIPKYYGGLNISARDLAKFGLMVLHNGKFNRQQIVPKSWLNYCNDTTKRSIEPEKYCMGWYYSEDDIDNDIFYSAGFNGQIMLINRTNNTIIIRLGTDTGGVYWYPIMKKLSMIL
ncbi:MAG: serine hydrolase [Chitinophagales bacterium]|nr:serine hydrolase [Chitinophagales bacterium]